MAITQRELLVQVAYETDEANLSRTTAFVTTSIKASCRNLKNGSVIITVYQDDNMIGRDITGAPSAELLESADLFETE